MEINNLLQLKTFLNGMVLGLLIGLAFDFFRILRITFPFGTVHVAVQDFILVLLSSLGTIAYIVLYGDGYIRFYILLAEGLGFVFYLKFVSPIILDSYKYVLSKIRGVVKWVLKHIFRPVAKGVYQIVKKTKKIGRKQKKCLQKKGKVLYNLCNRKRYKKKERSKIWLKKRKNAKN